MGWAEAAGNLGKVHYELQASLELEQDVRRDPPDRAFRQLFFG